MAVPQPKPSGNALFAPSIGPQPTHRGRPAAPAVGGGRPQGGTGTGRLRNPRVVADDRLRARLRTRPGLRAAAGGTPEVGRHEPLGLGDDRDGLLYVPDTAEPGAALLVFLHGATGSGHSTPERCLPRPTATASCSWRPTRATSDLGPHRRRPRSAPTSPFLDRVLDGLVDRRRRRPSRLAVGGVSDGASYALRSG